MCTVCMMTQTFDPLRHDPDQPIFADVDETTDAAENTSTTYSMSVGDTFNGTISSSSDEDWIRVELTAGEAYEIRHNGVSLRDPLVRLYDASGTEITSDDDSGGNLNSLLVYTPTSSGTYYISADAYGFNTGTYELSLSENIPTPPPGTLGTLDELATFLQEGTQGFSRSYNTNQSNQITVNLSGLTADGQQLARWAMEAWEMVADLDFVEVSSGEMITVDDEDDGAFAYYPNAGSTDDGVELNVSRQWLVNSGTTIDSYSFQTYVHEFGHALGLRHQGNYDASQGPVTYNDDAYFTNDSWQMTVMSYFSQTENTSTDASYAYLSGAMMADIVAIQDYYGAPGASTATTGNTVYGQGSNLGNYLDEVFDWFANGTTSDDIEGNLMAFTVYDRGGYDTFNFGFLTDDARLDMRDAQFSDFGSYVGILGIARDTVIENAIVGSGDDTVTGNAVANTLTTNGGDDSVSANAGNDTVYAGAGDDTVYAGEGDDMVWGGDGQDLIYLNQGNDVFNDNGQGGDAGRDTVFTGLGDDTIEGGNGDDEFHGQQGNDVINARLGNDDVFGGGGSDTISTGEGNDTVAGGNGRDLVFLNQGDDVFNDNSQGGELGRDTVFGGSGNDTINGGSGSDLFNGGDGDDVIAGGDGFDTIYGGDGNDVITGGNGQDRIYMGAGDDRYVDTGQAGDLGRDGINGGEGADTFVFGAVISEDTIFDFELGVDTLELASELVGGLSAAQVAAAASAVGAGVLLSFGASQSILLEGLLSTTGLEDDISIV
ncbi:M10 family metallopeptidase C-terminal domain-containing protein [uncultured Tateyamaria sp.]|uniref:M10 family metallopeptidase C-terminal domain-containing protein n=1 Tax=uncultured Tateyamaria sp. TaxID=455651 RepID=UPI00263353DD|nr:M10 family metallopeptidase C-terminal domain-containing protein [uncultured Tateyamaria sp.]